MCFNLGAILLGGFLLCSCSDDEKMEEPPLFVKPVAPAVNPVDGIWIEEDTDDLENGQERHLTFNSDFTYRQDIYSVHPTFRVIRQSCSAKSLSSKYRSSLNP